MKNILTFRFLAVLAISVCSFITMESLAYNNGIVVADSTTRIPLPNASVFDRHGKAICLSDDNGVLPSIARKHYPLTIKYLGFLDKEVPREVEADTIFLQEDIAELPEFVVESRKQRLLHMLAYVREYSTLTTYTDTVFLFREKMVDYMIPVGDKVKFKGWTTPRLLTSKSYYRFSNKNGLDSVSDSSRHHFSWSDWLSLAPEMSMPGKLREKGFSTDTVFGRYSPTEIWVRDKDAVSVSVDILADSLSRKWVPDLSVFFHNRLDFDKFRIKYDYDGVEGDTLSYINMSGYSFNIDSNGRGHQMFRFNRYDEPFFVSTDAEVYILDKEYISVKEARRWYNRKFDIDEVGIYEPLEAPSLSSSIKTLVERVNSIDKDRIRLDFEPDQRLAGIHDGRKNFRIGRRALLLLKGVAGITQIKSHRNSKKNWSNFRNRQLRKNNKVVEE